MLKLIIAASIILIALSITGCCGCCGSVPSGYSYSTVGDQTTTCENTACPQTGGNCVCETGTCNGACGK